MAQNYLDNLLLAQLWNKTSNTFQLRTNSLYYDNAKTYAVGNVVGYNNKLYECILSSTGNLPTNTTYWKEFTGGGSGTITDVKVNNISVVTSGVANILTKTAYNSSSNKIVTESDLPQIIDLRG